MTVLIIGYPDSGKSAIAEDMVMEMSAPGERVYLATMIPYGDEGRLRIGKHRKLREGKDFVTLEAPFDISEAFDAFPIREQRSCTVLLECLSNLVANEMFERHTDADAAADRITADVLALSGRVRDLVIVSNHFEITKDFDEETVLYAKTLDAVNDRLSAVSDKTIRL